jgi:galactan endo-1,6-beta-galactosidase
MFSRKVVEFQGTLTPGLGLNIVRYNAGASGSSTVKGQRMIASPRISPRRQIQGFWLDPSSKDLNSSSWDWSADANQRAMLQKAKDRGADRFELFSNSPMWWMCADNNPSGAAKADQDNLLPAYYSAHAYYLAAVAKIAQSNWGIHFQSVDPFNEPSTAYWNADGTQEGCHFDLATQSTIIRQLRKELDRFDLSDTVVAASDETSYNQATSTWRKMTPSAKRFVSKLNVHGYQSSGKRDLLRASVQRIPIWNSEYGEEDSTGLRLARNLTLDFQLLHPSAWCYWQAVDGGGWGLVPSGRVNLGTVNTKFFVLAQYSRHIRPGMEIIESGDMNTVMAFDRQTHRLVIVSLNDEGAQRAHFFLNSFAKCDGPVTRWTTQFLSGDRYVERHDVNLKNKVLDCQLPAGCVQTLEIDGVSF